MWGIFSNIIRHHFVAVHRTSVPLHGFQKIWSSWYVNFASSTSFTHIKENPAQAKNSCKQASSRGFQAIVAHNHAIRLAILRIGPLISITISFSVTCFITTIPLVECIPPAPQYYSSLQSYIIQHRISRKSLYFEQ